MADEIKNRRQHRCVPGLKLDDVLHSTGLEMEVVMSPFRESLREMAPE
jgi:hypothetical protein